MKKRGRTLWVYLVAALIVGFLIGGFVVGPALTGNSIVSWFKKSVSSATTKPISTAISSSDRTPMPGGSGCTCAWTDIYGNSGSAPCIAPGSGSYTCDKYKCSVAGTKGVESFACGSGVGNVGDGSNPGVSGKVGTGSGGQVSNNIGSCCCFAKDLSGNLREVPCDAPSNVYGPSQCSDYIWHSACKTSCFTCGSIESY